MREVNEQSVLYNDPILVYYHKLLVYKNRIIRRISCSIQAYPLKQLVEELYSSAT